MWPNREWGGGFPLAQLKTTILTRTLLQGPTVHQPREEYGGKTKKERKKDKTGGRDWRTLLVMLWQRVMITVWPTTIKISLLKIKDRGRIESQQLLHTLLQPKSSQYDYPWTGREKEKGHMWWLTALNWTRGTGHFTPSTSFTTSASRPHQLSGSYQTHKRWEDLARGSER